jgi:PAS domain S-box-containing protein
VIGIFSSFSVAMFYMLIEQAIVSFVYVRMYKPWLFLIFSALLHVSSHLFFSLTGSYYLYLLLNFLTVLSLATGSIWITKNIFSSLLSLENKIIRQKELTERLTDGIEERLLLLSKDLRIQWVNRKLKESSGYTEEEILGKHCYEVTHKRDRKCESPNDICPIDKILETGKPASEIHVHYDKDGGESYVEVTAYPLKENNEITGYIHLDRDLTEKIRAEQEIRKLTEFQAELLEHSPIGILRLDKKMRIIYENPEMKKIIGVPKGDESRAMGADIRTLPSIVSAGVGELLNDLKKGKEISGEIPFQSIYGKEAVIDFRGVPLIREGDFAGAIILIQDVTKRKRAEDKLRESENKYRMLMEQASDGIFIADREGNYVDVNSRACEMLGYSREELLRFNMRELVFQGDAKVARAHFTELLAGKSILFERQLRRKDGESIVVEISAKMLEDGRIQAIKRDITERKRAEEEMRRRLLKYRLEEGKLYLVEERMPTMSLDAFLDLLNVGYRGLVISRTPKEELFKGVTASELEFLWLAEIEWETTLSPKLVEIELKIDNLPKKTAILIDRLDYLIFKNGFENVLTFVQHLREFAYIRNHIVILSMDSLALNKRDLWLLKKETMEVEVLHKASLSEDLLEVLRFIYKQNNIGLKPSYTVVGKELGISKPTVRKRIKALISSEYVVASNKGNRKVVELTERGKNLFAE